jgi:hypothetical protein
MAAQQVFDASAGQTAGVLQQMGVLDDDRRPSFEGWLEPKLVQHRVDPSGVRLSTRQQVFTSSWR